MLEGVKKKARLVGRLAGNGRCGGRVFALLISLGRLWFEPGRGKGILLVKLLVH